jgi:hypothetical protein
MPLNLLTFSAISQSQLEIFGLARDTPEPKAGEPDTWLYCDAELTICALDGGQCASSDDEYSVILPRRLTTTYTSALYNGSTFALRRIVLNRC